MTSALVLVAGLMVVPAALGQEDEVTVQEGPPLSASPTATVAAKDQYDGGGKKKEVVVGGGRTLPETGGVSSIALLAGALLIGGGVMSLALFRRS
jgi:LPXTG-motif cell wall-anchored protein